MSNTDAHETWQWLDEDGTWKPEVHPNEVDISDEVKAIVEKMGLDPNRQVYHLEINARDGVLRRYW